MINTARITFDNNFVMNLKCGGKLFQYTHFNIFLVSSFQCHKYSMRENVISHKLCRNEEQAQKECGKLDFKYHFGSFDDPTDASLKLSI